MGVVDDQVGMVRWGAVMLKVPSACHPHVWAAPVQGMMQVVHDLEVHSCAHTQTPCHIFTVDNSAGIKEADKHQVGHVQVGSWFQRSVLILVQP